MAVFVYYIMAAFFCPGCRERPAPEVTPAIAPRQETFVMQDPNTMTEKQWLAKLTPQQYDILRNKATERPFTGKYYKKPKESGVYVCAGCGNELFKTDGQFNSHCGWPSFSEPAQQAAVAESADTSYGMTRIEITCSRCGGHLGHVFNDGPGPNGLRYCINSAAMEFKKADNQDPH